MKTQELIENKYSEVVSVVEPFTIPVLAEGEKLVLSDEKLYKHRVGGFVLRKSEALSFFADDKKDGFDEVVWNFEQKKFEKVSDKL